MLSDGEMRGCQVWRSICLHPWDVEIAILYVLSDVYFMLNRTFMLEKERLKIQGQSNTREKKKQIFQPSNISRFHSLPWPWQNWKTLLIPSALGTQAIEAEQENYYQKTSTTITNRHHQWWWKANINYCREMVIMYPIGEFSSRVLHIILPVYVLWISPHILFPWSNDKWALFFQREVCIWISSYASFWCQEYGLFL